MELLSAIFEFIVFTVGIKIIVGHFIADQLVSVLKSWFSTTERKQAIYDHYILRAQKAGHESDDVLTCGQDKCAVFAA